MTICVHCTHHRPTAWGSDICLASPLPRKMDPVHGVEKPIGRGENGYAYCRDINAGACPLYQPEEK